MNTATGGTSVQESALVSDGARALTRTLLRLGVIAGPFYLAIGLVMAVVRPGFDLARHPLSLLAIGPGGWVQTVNFVLTGLMVIAAAWGVTRALGPKARVVGWTLGAYGVSMLLAAIFRADPVDGFPPGTPEGVPAAVSTTGLLHFMAGGIGFIALAIACFAAASALRLRNYRSLSRFSLLAGLLVIVGFFGSFVVPAAATLGIWLSVVAGWLWLSVTSLALLKGLDQRTPAG